MTEVMIDPMTDMQVLPAAEAPAATVPDGELLLVPTPEPAPSEALPPSKVTRPLGRNRKRGGGLDLTASVTGDAGEAGTVTPSLVAAIDAAGDVVAGPSAPRNGFELERRRLFAADQPRLDRMYAELPDALRRRIDRFRRNNRDFRWRFEAAELAACSAAVLIAGAYGTQSAVNALGDSPNLRVVCERVPGLADLGLSSNAFGKALQLASMYLNRPEMASDLCGVLCGVVGCQSYGCKAAGELAERAGACSGAEGGKRFGK